MALVILLAFLALIIPIGAQPQAPQFTNFTYTGFNDTKLLLEGASVIKPSGALRLTNSSLDAIGHAFYPSAVRLFDKSSLSFANVSSFSTHFVFQIKSPTSGPGGYGLAFTLAPSIQFPGAGTGHFLGLFNSTNDGNSTNHIFAVEFDTVNGHNENSDTRGNHVGININSVSSVAIEPAAYIGSGNNATKEDLDFQSGEPVQAWIEYDGTTQVVSVTVAPFSLPRGRPDKPLISHHVDLTRYLQEKMYVGFSSSTGNKASSHYILGWSFRTNGSATELNLSQLPRVPIPKSSSSFKPQTIVLISCFSAIALVLTLVLAYFKLYKNRTESEVLEDWELDCPHRFSYKDLYTATRGFKESEMIGVGGFGSVYRGMSPTTGCEVAVKRITRNSIEGMREFAAEIESLGRLRHKNLVKLQGWCKQKNNLLLVYDYIPNGSLDSLLFHPIDHFILSWEDRFNILKGVAAGLLYLHEEWEQLVVHRDVKSSNVLIDADMNARLGDFGLARLYDHGVTSHTTNVVGTIGYIAPELARTGKPSAWSDVFAYGILLLEVACGRRPIGSDNFILVDWVMECHQMGQILDAVDPKLNSSYEVQEMVLVLQLGLLCSHQKAEVRPTMRQVTRYLHGDDALPPVNSWGDSLTPPNSRLLQSMPSDSIASYASSSVGYMSFGSIDAGR